MVSHARSFDPQWLDLQYNNRARIPEHPQIFSAGSGPRSCARAKSSRRLDVRYGSGPCETLDVFPSPRPTRRCWSSFTAATGARSTSAIVSFVAPSFVQDGAMVVRAELRVVPGSRHRDDRAADGRMRWPGPIAMRRCMAAIRKRIVVAGHSAGGHLAAMMLSCHWPAVASDLPADGWCASALSISGLYDLEPVRAYAVPERRSAAHARAGSQAERRATSRGPRARCTPSSGRSRAKSSCARTELIQQAWGEAAVPVCESIAGHESSRRAARVRRRRTADCTRWRSSCSAKA